MKVVTEGSPTLSAQTESAAKGNEQLLFMVKLRLEDETSVKRADEARAAAVSAAAR